MPSKRWEGIHIQSVKIKPTQDWICGERLEYKHKFLEVYGQKTHRARVIAVGPGYYRKAFVEVEDPINGKRFRTRAGKETQCFIPTTVRPGEVVEFSNAGWEDRIIEGKTYTFFRERSVIGYADESDTEGLQGHNSAVI